MGYNSTSGLEQCVRTGPATTTGQLDPGLLHQMGVVVTAAGCLDSPYGQPASASSLFKIVDLKCFACINVCLYVNSALLTIPGGRDPSSAWEFFLAL